MKIYTIRESFNRVDPLFIIPSLDVLDSVETDNDWVWEFDLLEGVSVVDEFEDKDDAEFSDVVDALTCDIVEIAGVAETEECVVITVDPGVDWHSLPARITGDVTFFQNVSNVCTTVQLQRETRIREKSLCTL